MNGNDLLAVYLRSLLDVALDPVVAVVGAVFGMAASRWWQRILGSFVLALIVFVALGPRGDFGGLPLWWILLGQTTAMFIWTAFGALARWFLDNMLNR